MSTHGSSSVRAGRQANVASASSEPYMALDMRLLPFASITYSLPRRFRFKTVPSGVTVSPSNWKWFTSVSKPRSESLAPGLHVQDDRDLWECSHIGLDGHERLASCPSCFSALRFRHRVFSHRLREDVSSGQISRYGWEAGANCYVFGNFSLACRWGCNSIALDSIGRDWPPTDTSTFVTT